MKIAFIASFPIQDVSSWSGIVYFSHKACEHEFGTVISIETLFLDRILRSLNYRIRNTGIDLLRTNFVSLVYAAVLKYKIRRNNPDIIIAVACSQKMSRLGSKIPWLHMSDATFRSMCNYYVGPFSSLGLGSIRSADAMEKRVLHRCAAAIFSSQWAADSAVRDYGITEEKIHIVPMGANIENLLEISPRRLGSRINLLFVGVEWLRKGGDLTFEIFQALKALGLDVSLDIVGCTPPDAVANEVGIRCHGFLSKNIAAERTRLDGLYREATFFILPSLQEAYGLVYCEACAYGLPILARDTGGVSTIVRQNVNGVLFAPDDDARPYVDLILSLIQHPERYQAMSNAGLKLYRDVLNWTVWARSVRSIIDSIFQRPPPRVIAQTDPSLWYNIVRWTFLLHLPNNIARRSMRHLGIQRKNKYRSAPLAISVCQETQLSH